MRGSRILTKLYVHEDQNYAELGLMKTKTGKDHRKLYAVVHRDGQDYG